MMRVVYAAGVRRRRRPCRDTNSSCLLVAEGREVEKRPTGGARTGPPAAPSGTGTGNRRVSRFRRASGMPKDISRRHSGDGARDAFPPRCTAPTIRAVRHRPRCRDPLGVRRRGRQTSHELGPRALASERCSQDARFDGQFFTAVTTTSIYCGELSGGAAEGHKHALPPVGRRCQAAASGCKRCRPNAAPGSPVGPAFRPRGGRSGLIADGVVDREGVDGLASRLGTAAALERQWWPPSERARSPSPRTQRAQASAGPARDVRSHDDRHRLRRRLREHPQFNDTSSPCSRSRRRSSAPRAARRHERRSITSPALPRAALPRQPLRQPRRHRGPVSRCGTGLPRTLRLPHGRHRRARARHRRHQLVSSRHDLRDFPVAVARCRRLLDSMRSGAVDELLARDACSVRWCAAPGRRVPRTVDEEEIACGRSSASR